MREKFRQLPKVLQLQILRRFAVAVVFAVSYTHLTLPTKLEV